MKNPLDKILNWYFSKKSLPYWCVLIADCAIVGFVGVFVYWMFTRGALIEFYWDKAFRSIVLFVLLSVVGFKLFRTYSSVIRYSSFVDLLKVAYGNLLNMALAIGVSKLIYIYHIRYFYFIK